MSKTPDELKLLKTRYLSAQSNYLRFSDSKSEKSLKEIEAEMRLFMPEVLKEEWTQHFIQAVEGYIVRQKLLPEMLWQHIKNLSEEPEQVIHWRDELRSVDMTDEEFEIACLMAADLKHHKAREKQQMLARAAQEKKRPENIRNELQKSVRILLQLRKKPVFLALFRPKPGVETLISEIHQWCDGFAVKEAVIQGRREERIAIVQHDIVTHIATLKELHVPQDEIDHLIREVWSNG